MDISSKICLYVRKFGRLLILSAIFVLLSAPLHVSGAQKVLEYHIKAVFLYNLSHFVNWPATATEKLTPFTIGIYGPDPFGIIIDQTIAKEEKFKKPFKILRLNSPDNIPKDCNIIYISSGAMNEWNLIHEKIAGLPILSVSDNKVFTQSGGMVSLLKNDQKIEVEINLREVRDAGLSMSAKLLRLARIVE